MPSATALTPATATGGAGAHQRLAAQHAVARVVAEADSLSDAAPRILQAICECLDWDIGMLWIVDRAVNRIRCAETWLAPGVLAPGFVAFSRSLVAEVGQSLPGHAWRLGTPVWVDDLAKGGPVFVRGEVAARDGLHGAIAFPIVLGREVLGVMDFLTHEVRHPDADVLEMLTTFGTQIGQFIERKRAQDALRASEQQLQSIIDNTTAVVYVTDLEGRVLLMNRREIPAQLRERHEEAARSGLLVEQEEVVDEKAQPRTFLSHRFLLHDREGRAYAVCGISTDISDRKRAEDDLRSLAVQLSAAEDVERRRLARDIHDSIGQTLSALKMELARLGGALLPSMSLLDQVIGQTRSLIFDLYPSMLDDLGLVPTLESYVEQWSQRHAIQSQVSETGQRRPISMAVTNYLFRAIKELLNNVAKHARARQVLVAVHWSARAVRIAVNDDGVGFDPETALAPLHRRGLGLADIRERVRFLGGRMLFERASETGSQVILELPIMEGPRG
jgi:signal transduction histidine kinase